jgi:hypothetical protein
VARIRTIKPDFFRHEALFEAEKKTGLPLRLAYAGLWTAADREGRFKWKPRELKLDCLPYDEVDFAAVLDALHECGAVVRYTVDGGDYGHIPSWHKHQHINQREAQSTLPDPASARTCMHVPAHGEGKGKEGEGKENIRAVAVAPRPDVKSKFDEFWKVYPKRDGANPKAPSFKKFRAALASGADPDEIITAAGRYASEVRAKGQERTPYVAQAMTWLGQQRWGDYGQPEPECASTAPDLYFKQGSAEFDAWDQHMRRTTGKGLFVGRGGGWLADSRWPPGYDPPAETASREPAATMRTIQ